MQIECPHCQTVFKLTEEQLHVADGMVRCGLCHEVFNALADSNAKDSDHTTAEADTAAIAERTDEPAQTGAAPDEAASRSEVTAARSEPGSDTNRQSTASDDLFDGVQSKLIPDEYRIPELHQAYSLWRDVAWSIAIIALTISLFVEYAWFNRNQLISRPELSTAINQLCKTVDCDVLELRNPAAIEMIARNIYSHPNIANALMVSVTMINHATFAQPYPDINIDFSDVRGDVIASRVFKPEEYLLLNKYSIKMLPSGVATDFHLEIQDPGPEAMTYEFSFL